MKLPESIKTYGLIALLIMASFGVTALFVDPAPPSTIRIAAGNSTGAYYQYAKQYQSALKADGITATILETAGSAENAALLNLGKVDVAFIQSGIGAESDSTTIEALSSLYYEPLWVFMHGESSHTDLQGLRGKTVSLGANGSGTEAIGLQLLSANDVAVNRSDLVGDAAISALKANQIDAIFLVGSVKSAAVRSLLTDESVTLLSFDRATAYTRAFPFLSKATLPEGGIDLAKNIPHQDISLIGPVAQLAVHSDLNGSLKTLLVDKAHHIHGGADIFSGKGAYPTLRYLDYPVAEEAEIYVEHGPSFLQRVLPFWVADTINRFVVMVIPLIGVMFPLVKVASPAYRWRTRSKIYRWYRGLNQTEEAAASDQLDMAEALKALDAIETEVKKTEVPLSYADELYALRLHIQMIKDRLQKGG